MLIVTIEESQQGVRVDIQVNPEQKMIETLKILQENGVLREECVYEGMKVKSIRKKEYLHTGLTFEQNGIQESDILVLLS